MTEVEELLSGEVLEINLIELGCSHENGVISEVYCLGGLISGELVPHHEVSSLVTPLHDGHEMFIGSTKINFALRKN